MCRFDHLHLHAIELVLPACGKGQASTYQANTLLWYLRRWGWEGCSKGSGMRIMKRYEKAAWLQQSPHVPAQFFFEWDEKGAAKNRGMRIMKRYEKAAWLQQSPHVPSQFLFEWDEKGAAKVAEWDERIWKGGMIAAEPSCPFSISFWEIVRTDCRVLACPSHKYVQVEFFLAEFLWLILIGFRRRPKPAEAYRKSSHVKLPICSWHFGKLISPKLQDHSRRRYSTLCVWILSFRPHPSLFQADCIGAIGASS